MNLRNLRLVVVLSCCSASAAAAQGLAAELEAHQPFENLRVIDRSISAADLATRMREISRAIGSERGCLYCHVGVSGEPLSTWNFASDAKPEKKVARVMLRMVDAMNAEYLAALPGREAPVTVTCRTCHAGRPRPIPLEDLLFEVVQSRDLQAAEAEYRKLRERYYAADAYDFNEYVLRRLASRIDPGSPDVKIGILRLNLEFYPDSWRSLLAMGEAYLLLSEPELAEISFERSLAIRVSTAGLDGLRRARKSSQAKLGGGRDQL